MSAMSATTATKDARASGETGSRGAGGDGVRSGGGSSGGSCVTGRIEAAEPRREDAREDAVSRSRGCRCRCGCCCAGGAGPREDGDAGSDCRNGLAARDSCALEHMEAAEPRRELARLPPHMARPSGTDSRSAGRPSRLAPCGSLQPEDSDAAEPHREKPRLAVGRPSGSGGDSRSREDARLPPRGVGATEDPRLPPPRRASGDGTDNCSLEDPRLRGPRRSGS